MGVSYTKLYQCYETTAPQANFTLSATPAVPVLSFFCLLSIAGVVGSANQLKQRKQLEVFVSVNVDESDMSIHLYTLL